MQLQNTQKTSQLNIIQENISLKDKNWFETGGIAKYYAQPTNSQEFAQALEFANTNKLEIFVLGEGANILISDEGFNGLVIKPQITEINFVEPNLALNLGYVTAGAGVKFQGLIDFCLNNNLSGLEEFSGIPGTVGGSVYINIHYFEFLLSQFLIHATVIEKSTGKVLQVDNAWFNFGYNQSTLLAREYFLIDATFKLKKVDPIDAAYHKGRRDEIIRHRVKRYPYKGTCGSFFRNFYESEVTHESAGKKMIYVAYYLDKIGVKGNLKVGGAIVSHQHANMLVNLGQATTHDIVNLARTMQQLVFDNFGIMPKSECQMIGFKESPLI
ncbi:MAG: UDP-N-acetylmuramate dehydrogenase [Candidatus Babeliales bacterium]|nr:UDP-N-acetylmuramate dehydrogenase [Candidatus Babeliales bacterium]